MVSLPQKPSKSVSATDKGEYTLTKEESTYVQELLLIVRKYLVSTDGETLMFFELAVNPAGTDTQL